MRTSPITDRSCPTTCRTTLGSLACRAGTRKLLLIQGRSSGVRPDASDQRAVLYGFPMARVNRMLAVVCVAGAGLVACGSDGGSAAKVTETLAVVQTTTADSGGTESTGTLAVLAEIIRETCKETNGEFAESPALFVAAETLRNSTGDDKYRIDDNELSRAKNAFFDLYRESRDESRDVSIMQPGLCQRDAEELVAAIEVSALES